MNVELTLYLDVLTHPAINLLPLNLPLHLGLRLVSAHVYISTSYTLIALLYGNIRKWPQVKMICPPISYCIKKWETQMLLLIHCLSAVNAKS